MGAVKKTGGKLGLGIKKLETKVDDSLFDQAPAPEPVKAAETSAPASNGTPTAAAASRFSYDMLNAVS